MRRRTRPHPLALLTFALAASTAHATDYWVSPAGDDAGSGLSSGAAWRTLIHAAGEVGPGDTVHVLDGQYQGFYLTTSGAPGNPITFVAEGSSVEITADNPVTPDGINLEGASWIVIDGFIVNHRTRTGVRAVEADHVTVRNCRLGWNGRWGILTGHVDDFLAEHNQAHHSGIEHGIYVSNACVRPIVRDNLVWSNRGNGLHFNGDQSFGGTGLVEDALVERNVIWDNGAGGGSGINMDGAVDGVIRNNLLYGNHASGISLYRIDAAAGASGNLVVNNTIVQPSDARWAINIDNGSTGNLVRNNILWNDHGFRGAISIDGSSRPGFVSDYNTVVSRFSADGGGSNMSLTAWQGLGYDVHSFVATPAQLFLAPGSDWHLRSDAPAIDAGTAAAAPPTDLDGVARPLGGGVDIGAYEFALLTCGDGVPDAGEQCGEPGLACADPCTVCAGCTCVAPPPVCGDALVCGGEACESDGDCDGGKTCDDCACVTPAPCAGGAVLQKPSLVVGGDPLSVSLRAEAVVAGIDPAASGLRIVVDSAVAAPTFDVTLPAGPAWVPNGSGTQWKYTDPLGTIGGVRKVVVQDRSRRTPGLLKLTMKTKGGTATLPPASDVRTAASFGAGACAGIAWGGPGDPRPSCAPKGSRLRCR